MFVDVTFHQPRLFVPLRHTFIKSNLQSLAWKNCDHEECMKKTFLFIKIDLFIER